MLILATIICMHCDRCGFCWFANRHGTSFFLASLYIILQLLPIEEAALIHVMQGTRKQRSALHIMMTRVFSSSERMLGFEFLAKKSENVLHDGDSLVNRVCVYINSR
ncbi:unnamed protein product [Orchesella dallaii]|uniref:Uncharacterized protein n=1 Tax=Orchesella dallaii TaxID=48710 RepID=A0ABP1RZ40_9HEXA